MRVLVDTHVFLWWVEGDRPLPPRARAVRGIDVAHLGRVESLEPHHGDPFDRMLVAQALEEKIPVVTADPVFRKYGIKRIW